MPSTTRRRALLLAASGASAGLVGCLAPSRSGSTAPDATVSADRLGLTASVLAAATDDHPLRLQIALRNDHDQPLTVETHRALDAPFTGVWGSRAAGPGRLALYPVAADAYGAGPCPDSDRLAPIPPEPVDGCWQLDCEVVTPFDGSGLATVPAGGRFAATYALLDATADGCAPAGTYTFEERSRVGLGDVAMAEPTVPDQLDRALAKRLELTLEADGSATVSATHRVTERGSSG